MCVTTTTNYTASLLSLIANTTYLSSVSFCLPAFLVNRLELLLLHLRVELLKLPVVLQVLVTGLLLTQVKHSMGMYCIVSMTFVFSCYYYNSTTKPLFETTAFSLTHEIPLLFLLLLFHWSLPVDLSSFQSRATLFLACSYLNRSPVMQTYM